MSTEQSETEDSGSIIERMTSALSTEPEAAPEEEASPQAVDDSEPEESGEQSEEEYFDVPDEDGQTYKVPAKLKESFLRWQDYTKKTQHASLLQEKAQDALHFAEAQQKIVQAVVADVAEYRAVQSELQRYENVDWQGLYDANPGQAMKLRDQRDELRGKLGAIQQEIQKKSSHVKASTESHQSYQWELAQKGFIDSVGRISAEENVAMEKAASKLGFSKKELQSRFADPRILQTLHAASKWLELQESKGAAVKSAQKAPPVVKPGTVNQSAGTSKYKDARSSLKKSGDVRDAARLLALRG